MKKIIALILAALMLFSFAACENASNIDKDDDKGDIGTIDNEKDNTGSDKNDDEKDDTHTEDDNTPKEPVVIAPSADEGTMGYVLWNVFYNTLKQNFDIGMQDLANTLVTDPVIQFTGMASPIEVGAEYFMGFGDYRIAGYDSAAVYSPMMGSIAFVGYVFDLTENTDVNEFIKGLTDHCDTRWNICVEAEQTVVGAVGNKVFFVMCPKGGEEEKDEVSVIAPKNIAEGSLGYSLWKAFEEAMAGGTLQTANEIATAVCQSENAPKGLMVSAVEPGLLNGFNNYEVKNFSEGVVFAPMFGSVAFIGYVFEVNEGTDLETFVAELSENANPAWNICVTADQTVFGAYGNMVFFVMCPAKM